MNTENNALDFRDPGHLQHNAVLSENETRRRFAECCNQEPFETNKYIDALGTFIAREIAHGNRLNFGAFGVRLHMSGGFQGANAPFDEKKNAISVCITPGKEMKSAVKALKPVNVTVSGLIPPVHPSQPDEGVWFEDDTGEKVAVATIVSSALSHTDCTLEGALARGDYWTVIQGRYLNEPNLIRCRHRVKVVSVSDTTAPNAASR